MIGAAGPRVSLILIPGGDEDATLRSLAAQTSTAWDLVRCRPGRDPIGELNYALARAGGDFVAFVDAGDALEPDAVARALDTTGPDVDLVYTDESTEEEQAGSQDLFLKPDWSPDQLLGHHYVGRLALLRRDLVDEIGRVRASTGDAWEYDLTLRASRDARRIEHVAAVAYHRARPSSAGSDGARLALSDHLAALGRPAVVAGTNGDGALRLQPRLRDQPLVSVVIPTAGSTRRVRGETLDLAANAVESVVAASTYPHYEIVVVVDPSVSAGTRDRLHAAAGDRLRLVDFTRPFNFARKVNEGVLRSSGEYVVFLNDDTAVITPGWLESMLVFATDPGVGAVGAFLRFADHRYQHVGVILLDGNPGHPYYGFPADYPGYHQNLQVPCNYLAVTAACLMTPRGAFERVGGLSTAFPANYNDVDYCLKLRHVGLRVVCTPEAQLFHYESSSRGPGPVATAELELLHRRWGPLTHDPYYNPSFLRNADFQTPRVVAPTVG